MSATTAVKDEHILLTIGLLVQTVGQSSCSGLIDNTENIQTRNSTGILGRLALGVIEVGRNRDYRVSDLLTQVALGSRLHLLEHGSGDLLSTERLSLTVYSCLNERLVCSTRLDLEGPVGHIGLYGCIAELAANQTLSIKDRIDRVRCSLGLGCIADETLLGSEGHVGGSSTIALVICDNFNTVILPDTDAGVCSSKINPDCRHYTL